MYLVAGLASIIGLLLFTFSVTACCVYFDRRRHGATRITSRGNRKRVQWIYWIPPQIHFTRHEYQRAIEARAVGERIIENRNSTYAKLPLCKVKFLPFSLRKYLRTSECNSKPGLTAVYGSSYRLIDFEKPSKVILLTRQFCQFNHFNLPFNCCRK
jgi:hypothetical protein